MAAARKTTRKWRDLGEGFPENISKFSNSNSKSKIFAPQVSDKSDKSRISDGFGSKPKQIAPSLSAKPGRVPDLAVLDRTSRLRSGAQPSFHSIGPVWGRASGLSHRFPRGVRGRTGGATIDPRAGTRCSLRNGTLPFEAAVASVGTGRKCAFGAKIRISVKLEPNPCGNSQTRAERALERRHWQQRQGLADGSAAVRCRLAGRSQRRGGARRGRAAAACLRRPRGSSESCQM